MLSSKIKTAAELMSIALQAERQTTRRYSRLAEDMREAGNESAAALFERMVIEEREHERLLLAWMARESISEVTDIGPVHWRDPHLATTYDDEARDPHYSSPYQALAFAVHNEENAFRFYTQVAAEADNASVRECAEALAREELEHGEMFRAERRKAYHAERNAGKLRHRPDPDSIPNEATLLALAIHLDRQLDSAVGTLDVDVPGLSDLARNSRQQIDENETSLRRVTARGEKVSEQGVAAACAQIESGEGHHHPLPANTERELQRLGIYCDRCFVLYDAIVETTEDESILHTAQRLAASALDRASLLKHLALEKGIAP